jgi:hypothetical protein
MSDFVLRFRTAFPEYHAPERALLILRPGRPFPISVVWDVAEEHPNYGRLLHLLEDGVLDPLGEFTRGEAASYLAQAAGWPVPPLLRPRARRWAPVPLRVLG